MKKKISLVLTFVLVLSLVLSACTEPTAPETPEFVIASAIDDATKAEADKVLASFMQAFEEDKPADAAELFSEGFEATEENIGAFFAEVRKLVSSPFVPYDAYYISGIEVSDAPVKIKKDESAKDYIELTPAEDELYCAMYVSEGEKISYMMTVLLAKEGENFKIVWVNPTDFKYNGADANALYEKTKALSDDGKTIPAYISSCMLSNVFRPGGYFRYENDLEMEDICYKLFTEIAEKYPLPLALENTSDSAIYEIGISNDAELGIIPLFLFKTSVDVNDEAALKAESEKVITALEKLSPGLRKNFEYARFEATNDELTEETTSINSKTVNLKLK